MFSGRSDNGNKVIPNFRCQESCPKEEGTGMVCVASVGKSQIRALKRKKSLPMWELSSRTGAASGKKMSFRSLEAT